MSYSVLLTTEESVNDVANILREYQADAFLVNPLERKVEIVPQGYLPEDKMKDLYEKLKDKFKGRVIIE